MSAQLGEKAHDIRQGFIERGRVRAREFTWRECARSTLLAYQSTVKADGEEPRMQALF